MSRTVRVTSAEKVRRAIAKISKQQWIRRREAIERASVHDASGSRSARLVEGLINAALDEELSAS